MAGHNGNNTFRFQGRTYDMLDIFRHDDCATTTYMAFGKEKSFLAKVLKMGFVSRGGFVYDPTLWKLIPADLRKKHPWHTHFRVSKRTGRVFFGRPRVVVEPRR